MVRILVVEDEAQTAAFHAEALRSEGHEPVIVGTGEEGELASAFNETRARLHGSFERLQGFAGDVAHELRTP